MIGLLTQRLDVRKGDVKSAARPEAAAAATAASATQRDGAGVLVGAAAPPPPGRATWVLAGRAAPRRQGVARWAVEGQGPRDVGETQTAEGGLRGGEGFESRIKLDACVQKKVPTPPIQWVCIPACETRERRREGGRASGLSVLHTRSTLRPRPKYVHKDTRTLKGDTPRVWPTDCGAQLARARELSSPPSPGRGRIWGRGWREAEHPPRRRPPASSR